MIIHFKKDKFKVHYKLLLNDIKELLPNYTKSIKLNNKEEILLEQPFYSTDSTITLSIFLDKDRNLSLDIYDHYSYWTYIGHGDRDWDEGLICLKKISEKYYGFTPLNIKEIINSFNIFCGYCNRIKNLPYNTYNPEVYTIYRKARPLIISRDDSYGFLTYEEYNVKKWFNERTNFSNYDLLDMEDRSF